MDAAVLRAAGGLGFVRKRAALVDEAVRAFAEGVPGALDGAVTVLAVGGYGRRELFPGSDVDLVVLHQESSHRLAERIAEAVLYPLWDLGLATGNAVRTIAECDAAGETDPRALTALMDARVVAGSSELLVELNVAMDRGCLRDPARFVGVLDDVREERRRRFGRLAHATEPELKEPLGGLRDVAVPAWLARAGLPAADPPAGFADAAEVLRRARVALQLTTATRANRLEAPEHEPVAAMLGRSGEPEWEARDALVRDVLRAGRTIDVAVEELLASARLEVGRQPDAAADRAAALAATIESARPEARLPALVEALAAGDDGAHAIEIADAHGAMDAVFPAWPLLRGRPQRDPYHRFPVDVHLLRTAAEASAARGSVDDPAALLLGALLHDAGKIGRGSHVEVGRGVAREALDHLGAPEPTREDVLFLVGAHLLLADTATRRDIGEEEVVLRVARAVGDERRLAMLSVLTMADAAATGPAASSAWRLGLVRDLVARVERALRRGLVRSDDVDLLARAERAVRAALETAAGPERSEAFLRTVPSAYLRWVDPADAPTDLDLVIPRPADGEVRLAVGPAGDHGGGLYRVAVASRDRPGLLATIGGACTVAGLSILSAQIFTTSDGVALDVFVARGTYEDEVPGERWERLRRLLRDAISGEADVADAVDVLRRHARSSATDVPVTVRVDDEASDFHTVIEVGASDRAGLLFDLARAFSSLEIDVHLARVATYGHRVVDVFYVTDLQGRRLPEGVADSVREEIQKSISGL